MKNYQLVSEEQLAATLAASRDVVLKRLREMTPEHLGYTIGSGHFTRAEYVEAVRERLSGMSPEDRLLYERGIRRRKRAGRE
jgi:hypothetical protein